MLNFALLFRNYGILLVTIGLFVVLAVTADGFATERNLRNILDQQSMVIIAAAFMTIAIISGNFDVSVSAIFVTAPLFGLKVENMTGNVFLAVVAAIAVGLIMGAINGFIVTRLKINSFIGTLATSFMFFGAGFLISSRSLMRPETDAYRLIARSRFLGLTSATWIAIAVVIIATILLSRTRFGRNVFAVGGNMEAARLAGVAVNRVQTMAFLLLGAAAALAGVLNSSRSISAQPSDDFSFVFAVLTAVIVGGTSIAGGQGAIWRTTTAAFFLAFLNNGFNLLQIDPIWQRLIEGAVIIMAVAVDTWTKNRRA
ncbi:MAG: ABC transporter permease [Alphaproteobacteria bacterium]|jgi:ribose transport system permease protein|nr:ABC transporter permease [Pseudomonadota bacterium]MEC8153641.1 ABC transporter permease [Pseudomonadota bacterium]MEC8274184.1 ABC transporter permease [Pseudomonadota bacterium]